MWVSYIFIASELNILYKNYVYHIEICEALVVAVKEIGVEVNEEETKYMVMSRDQSAGKKSQHKDR
jgi:hypothetical protein